MTIALRHRTLRAWLLRCGAVAALVLVSTMLFLVGAGQACGAAASPLGYTYDSGGTATTSAMNVAFATAVGDPTPSDSSGTVGDAFRSFSAAEEGAAAAGDAGASAPAGRSGSPIEIQPGTNEPGEIGGRPYSGHAFDRMQGRGIPPSAVEDAINNPASTAAGSGGTTIYRGSDGVTVVVGSGGRVVTVW